MPNENKNTDKNIANSGQNDTAPLNITIVENIQENNYFETAQPLQDKPKKAKKRALSGFLLLLALSLLFIIILIIYLSFDINWAFWKRSTTTISKTPTYSLQTLNAPAETKPVHIEQKCYGVTIPYPIFKSSQRDTCSVFVSLRSPKGNVTVDYRIKESGDTLPDVTMRRIYTDKYIETNLTVNETPMIVFQNVKVEGYEKTAFFEKGNASIAITLKTEVLNNDRDEVFEEILKSFYCKEGCKYRP